MVPDRAGAGTRVDVVVSLAGLLAMDGASAIQDAWLAALLGEPASSPVRLAALARQPGYLAGKDAEAVACDAIIAPVVTGHPDLCVADQMIGLVLAYLDADGDGPAGREAAGHDRDAGRPGADGTTGRSPAAPARPPLPQALSPLALSLAALSPGALSPGALSPAALQALRNAMARIHRWGWRLVLHPDATTTAYGPRGQVLRSHGPPGQRPPGTARAPAPG